MTPPAEPATHGGMTGLEAGDTAGNYRLFARVEAAVRSPDYEMLARAVAEDQLVLAFLDGLPSAKRQPNLLFASARAVLGEPPTPATLHDLVSQRPAVLRHVMASRRTQTNEAARCAVLLPALASLDGPLALLEVGAAAGLTLFPDVYSYDYEGRFLAGIDGEAPVLRCRAIGPVPIPSRLPDVVWRAGIDLQPLDVTDDDDVAWLSCLVWPGEADRSERLEQAVAAVRKRPPTIHRGDLLDDLHQVAAEVPPGATLVVYHSAVLAYVGENKRRAFASAVSELGAVWLSNEGDGVLNCIGVGLRAPGSFLLVRDGHEVLAKTDPHGTWIEWLDEPRGSPPDQPSPRSGRAEVVASFRMKRPPRTPTSRTGP